MIAQTLPWKLDYSKAPRFTSQSVVATIIAGSLLLVLFGVASYSSMRGLSLFILSGAAFTLGLAIRESFALKKYNAWKKKRDALVAEKTHWVQENWVQVLNAKKVQLPGGEYGEKVVEHWTIWFSLMNTLVGITVPADEVYLEVEIADQIPASLRLPHAYYEPYDGRLVLNEEKGVDLDYAV